MKKLFFTPVQNGKGVLMKTYKLLETWAKSPFLNGADVLIAGECVKDSYPEVFAERSKGKVVLTVCPEANEIVFGKLASILTSTKPKNITVLTVECSPHCYTLHAAVNEAYYIAGVEIPRTHYVVLEGRVYEISPNAIRLSRYLSIVEKLLKKNPNVLDDLGSHSLEYKCDPDEKA